MISQIRTLSVALAAGALFAVSVSAIAQSPNQLAANTHSEQDAQAAVSTQSAEQTPANTDSAQDAQLAARFDEIKVGNYDRDIH